MSEDDRTRWDARHSGHDLLSIDAPTVPSVFARYEDEFPTVGHALELACGRGAASVWLASRGLDVVGVDISPVAIGQARELAARSGLDGRCRFEVGDLDDGLPAGPRAGVVLSHMFRGRGLERAIADRLAPGGLLAVAVLSEVGAGPGRYRARPGELRSVFSDLEVVASDEGSGRAWLLARRPHEEHEKENGEAAW